mmetsp:Transcript_8158/g.25440  ORF Transcript_8158/g.25440 Transcript_8158/m.25440 type:complete len:312 (-) Transcript_8158:221-1156(-)
MRASSSARRACCVAASGSGLAFASSMAASTAIASVAKASPRASASATTAVSSGRSVCVYKCVCISAGPGKMLPAAWSRCGRRPGITTPSMKSTSADGSADRVARATAESVPSIRCNAGEDDSLCCCCCCCCCCWCSSHACGTLVARSPSAARYAGVASASRTTDGCATGTRSPVSLRVANVCSARCRTVWTCSCVSAASSWPTPSTLPPSWTTAAKLRARNSASKRAGSSCAMAGTAAFTLGSVTGRCGSNRSAASSSSTTTVDSFVSMRSMTASSLACSDRSVAARCFDRDAAASSGNGALPPTPLPPSC